MSEPMSIEEIIKLIQDKHSEIENHRVYFSLRDMKLKFIRDITVDTVMYCIAIHELGLPITAQLIADMTDVTTQSIRNRLHNLGDKNVITLIRGSGYPVARWVLNPEFARRYYEGLEKQ